MRFKTIIIIIILVANIFVVKIVNAVMAAPSPVCEITAKVLKIKDALPREGFYYYRVNLDILDISTYKQEGHLYCDNFYTELVEESGSILILSEHNKDLISEGQKIKAKIHFRGDEQSGGYYLSDIQVLESIINNDVQILKNATTNKETQEIDLNYWHYIIPTIIITATIVFYIFFKNKKR